MQITNFPPRYLEGDPLITAGPDKTGATVLPVEIQIIRVKIRLVKLVSAQRMVQVPMRADADHFLFNHIDVAALQFFQIELVRHDQIIPGFDKSKHRSHLILVFT